MNPWDLFHMWNIVVVGKGPSHRVMVLFPIAPHQNESKCPLIKIYPYINGTMKPSFKTTVAKPIVARPKAKRRETKEKLVIANPKAKQIPSLPPRY